MFCVYLFGVFFTFAMFGNIQGGPSLRVFMNVKVINTYCKISTCATSWNHAQHIFCKKIIFQLLSSVVSKGWSIRMLLPNQSKHMPNHYSLQLCGPPNFHKICNFLCTQITTLTSTLQADTSVWFIQCDEQWGFACWPKYSNHKHCQSGCRQLEPCNTQIPQIACFFHFHLVLSLGSGASGFFCQSQQTIGETNTFCNIVGHHQLHTHTTPNTPHQTHHTQFWGGSSPTGNGDRLLLHCVPTPMKVKNCVGQFGILFW